MAKAAPPVREVKDSSDIDYEVTEYVHLRGQEKDIAARKSVLRENIMKHIVEKGEYDSDGNLFIELPKGLDASLIKNQRRSSRGVDNDAAMEILEALGVKDEAFVLVPELDTDYVWKLKFEGKLSDDDLDRIFPVKESFALIVE